MLADYLREKYEKYLGHDPTAGQERLFDRFLAMTDRRDGAQVLLVKGYAGTGKTTAVRAMVRILEERGIPVVLLAPTGRAAKVLSEYTGREAFTIHKWIYRQRSSKDGFGRFELGFNKMKEAFFFVDEASMISNRLSEGAVFGSGRLLDDLFDFVFQGERCRLVFIGDTAQLPPVGTALSEALDPKVLRGYGHTVEEIVLDEVVRQARHSGILVNATRLRQHIAGGTFSLPLFITEGYRDIVRLSRGWEFGELLEEHFQGYDPEAVTLIVRSNKQANQYNQEIRRRILYREEELTRGDLLMVVRNNYFWLQEEGSFLANGDILRVERVEAYEELYGRRFARAELSYPLGGSRTSLSTLLLLDTLTADGPSLTAAENKELFYRILNELPGGEGRKKNFKIVRQDEYFNALQVKFAYAVTCHKAQGGQWQTVFVDQGFVPQEQQGIEHLRWLYTAVTRATQRLYLTGFPDNYFGKGE